MKDKPLMKSVEKGFILKDLKAAYEYFDTEAESEGWKNALTSIQNAIKFLEKLEL